MLLYKKNILYGSKKIHKHVKLEFYIITVSKILTKNE